MIKILKWTSKNCMPCERQDAELDKIRSKYKNVSIVSIDRDENKDLVSQFGNSTPQLMYKSSGVIMSTKIGLQLEREIIQEIERIRRLSGSARY